MGELLGYARVSTLEQNADLQRDALSAAGCWRVFTEGGGAGPGPVYRLLADHDGGLLITQRMANLIGRAATHAGVPPPPASAVSCSIWMVT